MPTDREVTRDPDMPRLPRHTPLDVDEARVWEHGFALWLAWTLATALGMLLGLLAFLPFVPMIGLGLARVLVPLVAGLFVGLLQWLALKPYLTHSVDWVVNGGASWSLGYAFALVVIQLLNRTPLGALMGYLLFGAIIAVVQWPVLRREIRHAWPWVLTNVGAWALGSYVGEGLLNLVVRGDVVSQALSSAVISGHDGRRRRGPDRGGVGMDGSSARTGR